MQIEKQEKEGGVQINQKTKTPSNGTNIQKVYSLPPRATIQYQRLKQKHKEGGDSVTPLLGFQHSDEISKKESKKKEKENDWASRTIHTPKWWWWSEKPISNVWPSSNNKNVLIKPNWLHAPLAETHRYLCFISPTFSLFLFLFLFFFIWDFFSFFSRCNVVVWVSVHDGGLNYIYNFSRIYLEFWACGGPGWCGCDERERERR